MTLLPKATPEGSKSTDAEKDPPPDVHAARTSRGWGDVGHQRAHLPATNGVLTATPRTVIESSPALSGATPHSLCQAGVERAVGCIRSA